MLLRTKMVTALAAGFIVSTSAFAGAVIPLSNTNTLPRCFDCSTDPVNIGFDINFFGDDYSQLRVINFGYVSFGSDEDQKEIIPFSAYIDTRYAGSPVTYGYLIYDSHQAFAVNWVDVAPYVGPGTTGTSASRNSYQLILVERSDVGTGDFDIVFNFDFIQWQNKYGYGGAFFGYLAKGNFYGYWAHDDQLLINQLPYNSLNSNVAGRYVLEVRNGVVTNPLPFHSSIPEPETWAMLLAGLGLVTGVARRRAKMTG